MSKEGTAITYQYDENGLRTEKVVNGTTTRYAYTDDRLTHYNRAGQTMYIRYDANGEAIGFRHGGVEYTYMKNLQGDITGIVAANGEVVVKYNYDAYGRCLVVTGTQADTLGQLNPLRYRGYVYDSETELYYLQSRYYDPEMGRFINADDESVLKLDQGHTSEYSLFVYCLNNPVNAKDDDGMYAVAIGAGVWLASNPVGWVAAGLLLVAGVVIIAGMHYSASRSKNRFKSSKSKDSDPYARPGQKKQGRERKTKARKSDNWKPRSKPKPPKKHTPGRDHRSKSKGR